MKEGDGRAKGEPLRALRVSLLLFLQLRGDHATMVHTSRSVAVQGFANSFGQRVWAGLGCVVEVPTHTPGVGSSFAYLLTNIETRYVWSIFAIIRGERGEVTERFSNLPKVLIKRSGICIHY